MLALYIGRMRDLSFGAVAALPVVDTLKEVDADGRIVRVPIAHSADKDRWRDVLAHRVFGVLAGTGGCTAYDVVLILKRGRHDVRGCSVKLTSERAEVDPKVFTKIHMQFTVTGKEIGRASCRERVSSPV